MYCTFHSYLTITIEKSLKRSLIMLSYDANNRVENNQVIYYISIFQFPNFYFYECIISLVAESVISSHRLYIYSLVHIRRNIVFLLEILCCSCKPLDDLIQIVCPIQCMRRQEKQSRPYSIKFKEIIWEIICTSNNNTAMNSLEYRILIYGQLHVLTFILAETVNCMQFRCKSNWNIQIFQRNIMLLIQNKSTSTGQFTPENKICKIQFFCYFSTWKHMGGLVLGGWYRAFYCETKNSLPSNLSTSGFEQSHSNRKFSHIG